MTQETVDSPPQGSSPSLLNQLVQIGKRPRILLLLLAAWSALAAVTQLFVNSGIFLDTHDIEMDGAMGGFALSLQAIPLALLYLYCWRNPSHYHSVFWLALVQQIAIAAGVLYQWVIGTFSFESIVVPLVGSLVLALLSTLQIFESKPAESQ